MAANLGERSLAEVHQEGLDEILSELAHVQGPLSHGKHALGVPILDSLLEVFAPKALSTRQRQSDSALGQNSSMKQQAVEDEEMLLHSEAQAQDLDPSNVLLPDTSGIKTQQTPVVELASSLSASGKSQILYYLTALAILPRQYEDLQIGGHESAVVFIDTDDRFDADRLRTVARGIVLKRRAQLRPIVDTQPEDTHVHDLETLLVSSLQHVHVFRPQSSSALLATIRTLHLYLFDLPRHRSASRPLHMVAIDSATAFLWQDRLRDEVARTEEIGRPRAEIEREREQKQCFQLTDLYNEVITELKHLQSQFQCAIVYTTMASGGRARGADHYDQPQARIPSLRPALPAPWSTFPSLRLIVHRSSVRPFPPSMAAHVAVNDAPSRQSVVQQGKFSAWVNPWGHDEWPRRIVEAIEATHGGSFSFHVHESGVEIIDPDD
ncbi:uncharacterized protein N7515_004292 [Penicillium bovifimosum]|uniref:DNA recombination and repair protein Rad51-like C-terminal domain-containing protein n=1 Tax=Penicillium bovifimosum TaxID=126998 RepID=A0A9W9L3W1_9EURO|nr:uncharacterized protein N7515_004292 [Penicillium bovifimosum]KAJ5135014.1 hypothetical protein N7515_004292 [Penicillium bovifimosum]